jgi:site-specific recombinase
MNFLIEVYVLVRLLLNLNLSPLTSNNLGYAAINGDLAGNAYSQAFVLALGVVKLSAVGAPNENRKYFPRIGFIEI